jgi:hypothetical protein
MIRQLEDELREYDQVESGDLTLPHVEGLDQVAPFIAKVRIAQLITCLLTPNSRTNSVCETPLEGGKVCGLRAEG